MGGDQGRQVKRASDEDLRRQLAELEGDVARYLRLSALGAVLSVWRSHKGWSVETAAADMSIGHMTLRRLEAGTAVRPRTYAGMDTYFHLDPGTVARALGDDETLRRLAVELGVNSMADQGQTAAQWVESFAKVTARPSAPRGPIADAVRATRTAGVAAPFTARPMVVAVSELLSRLAVQPDRSESAEAAFQALLRLLPELSPAAEHPKAG